MLTLFNEVMILPKNFKVLLTSGNSLGFLSCWVLFLAVSCLFFGFTGTLLFCMPCAFPLGCTSIARSHFDLLYNLVNSSSPVAFFVCEFCKVLPSVTARSEAAVQLYVAL